MRLGRSAILRIAAAAALLSVAGLFWLLRDNAPAVPPHPLSAVTPAEVVAVSAAARPLPRNSPAFRAAALLPSRLVAVAPSQAASINWATARLLRIVTSTGLVVWLQLAERPDATWIRVNADPLPSAGSEARRQARAIKRLRLNAYRMA